MDFVGYFGFPSGEDPDTPSSPSRVKPASSTAASFKGTKNKRGHHNMHSTVDEPSMLKSTRGIIGEVGDTSDSEEEGEHVALAQLKRPCLSKRTIPCSSSHSSELRGRKQLILKPCNRSMTPKSSILCNSMNGVKKKTQMKRHQLDLHSFVIPKLTNSAAAAAVKSSAIEASTKASGNEMKSSLNDSLSLNIEINGSSLSDSTSVGKIPTMSRPSFVAASSLLHSKAIESFNTDDLEEFNDDNSTGNNKKSDELMHAEKSVCRQRDKILKEESVKNHKNDLLEEETNDFTDNNDTTCKSSGKTRIWKEIRRNNQYIFSIHSAVHGRMQLNTDQTHSSRLLHGEGAINILSYLFDRSILSTSQNATQGMASYVQSGKHWNVCRTVEIDLASKSTSGEVCSMSFDQEGVLLATGDDNGFVRIYDFDDLNALDRRKRNERNCLQPTNGDVANDQFIENDSDDPNEELSDLCIERVSHSKEETETLPPIDAVLVKPVLSFRCMSHRITDLQWNPNNQDQLAVSFAQSNEIQLYDVASPQTPLPRLVIGGSNNLSTKGREGIAVMRFLSSFPPKKSLASTHLLTGGSRGTVMLWSIPTLKRGQTLSDVHPRCLWSVDIGGARGEGCSDLLLLPLVNSPPTHSNFKMDNPLVLLSGNAGTLVLLDTSKCTRKSFSTTATPTIQSTWDLYHLTSRELTKLDENAKLPARRWMGVNRMCLIQSKCFHGVSSFRISLVLMCGWVLVVNLTLIQGIASEEKISGSNNNQSYGICIGVQIVHRTPQIQCFNSLNQKMSVLGGMALNFSLPDIPIPSSPPISYLRPMIWLADVKGKKYIMPSKDKYMLCEQHGTILSDSTSVHAYGTAADVGLRHAGDGLILLDVSPNQEKINHISCVEGLPSDNKCSPSQIQQPNVQRILARLPLTNGVPLSLAIHPAGEWMVVGYGLNGRWATAKSVELICMRTDVVDRKF